MDKKLAIKFREGPLGQKRPKNKGFSTFLDPEMFDKLSHDIDTASC